MRVMCALAALLAGAATLPAQAPVAPAGKLDSYLDQWEKRMADVKTMTAHLSRIDTDQVFKTSTKYNGWAAYMKSGAGPTAMNKAIYELKLEGKPDVVEKVICTGTYIFQWVPTKKEIVSHELPRGRGGEIANNASLGLMFGMKAAAAKARFDLKLAGEDANWVYVDVVPRQAEDKSEFAKAQLILSRRTFLPRRVTLTQANSSMVTWDLPNVDGRYFDAPRAPDGWKIVPAEKAAGAERPRVIRPASP